MEAAACVSVVDDDALVLRSLGRLLRSAGFTVRTFPSPEEFLAQGGGDPGCVVMDLSLPGSSGLQVQQALARSGDTRPVVFISGRGDVPSSVAGKLNKQIAAELGTSEKTVKVHRARMMRKMGADSLAGLVRAWTAIPATSAAAP